MMPLPKRGASTALGDKPLLKFEKPAIMGGQRIGIYGAGGIGKTTLAALASRFGRTVFFDLDGSLPVLNPKLKKLGLDVDVIPVKTYEDIIAALSSPGWDEVQNIVIDSITRVEELIVDFVVRTIPNDKGMSVKKIEDYGFGKGFTYTYETFLKFLLEFEALLWSGKNIIFTCHDCVASVPNPAGEDYQRWEPRLQSPAAGKSSIRHRFKEWVDHLLFIGYDIAVKNKKAQGGGSRTIWTQEQPHCMAKSRSLDGEIVYNDGDASLWATLFNKENKS